MTSIPPPTRVTQQTTSPYGERIATAGGSMAAAPSASRSLSLDVSVRPGRGRGLGFFLVVIGLMVSLSVVWSFAARAQLTASVVAETAEHLEYASRAFSYARTRAQSDLQGYCRVLVEDPRLKATLATEGIDAATVADILQDLGKLRGSGFLMVLSPEGRVFAEAGAAELRGLDLADSSVVTKAQAASQAVVGSWVLGGKVMDLGIMAIRFGDVIVAYLVVGASVGREILQAVRDQTGVHVASALATTIVLSSSPDLGVASSDPGLKAVFERIAAEAGASEAGAFKGRLLEISGERYVGTVVDLGDTAQSHRLVLVRPVAAALPAFGALSWMLLVPPLLVLLAVVFAMSGTRSPRRSR